MRVVSALEIGCLAMKRTFWFGSMPPEGLAEMSRNVLSCGFSSGGRGSFDFLARFSRAFCQSLIFFSFSFRIFSHVSLGTTSCTSVCGCKEPSESVSRYVSSNRAVSSRCVKAVSVNQYVMVSLWSEASATRIFSSKFSPRMTGSVSAGAVK